MQNASADKMICANCGELTSPQLTHCEWCYLELTTAPDAGDTASASARSPASRLVWKFAVANGRFPPQPLRNCPAIDDQGRIIACVQDELVMLRERADGQLDVDIRLTIGGFIPGSPTVGTDGLIRVHSLSGKVSTIRPDGQLAGDPVEVGEPLGWATPLVDDEGNTWVSAYSGGLIRLDPQGSTGSRQFLNAAAKFDSTGVICNKTLYIGADDHCVHAIDLSQLRGSRVWDHVAGRGRTGWYVNSPLMLIDGPLVVAVSRDRHLYAFSLDGAEVWKLSLPGQVFGSPVSSGHRLYLAMAIGTGESQSGCVICIDTRTRQIIWNQSIAAPVESTPVLADDTLIYFGDNAGIVHALDADGRPVWSESVGSPIRSAGALMPGRILFGTDDGTLVALRCESTGLATGWPKHLKTAGNRHDVTARPASFPLKSA